MMRKKMLVYGRVGGEETQKNAAESRRNNENHGSSFLQKMRRLLGRAAVYLPLVASCGSTAAGGGVDNPTPVEEPRRLAPRRGGESCTVHGSEIHLPDGTVRTDLLEPGESVRRIACQPDQTFVLTDRNALLMIFSAESQSDESMLVALDHKRVDMSEILATGLVDWAQSHSTVFFLTQDRLLTLIPVHDMGDTVPMTELDYDISGARMLYHNGFLFIGPASGNLIVMAFSPEYGRREMALPMTVQNPEFVVSEGRLLFGERNGEKVEIRMEGRRVEDVSLVP